MDKRTGYGSSVTGSQAPADTILSMSRSVIETIRNANPSVFVAIEETGFDTSTVPVTAYAPRGTRTFDAGCLERALESAADHRSARFPWSMRHCVG